MDGLGLKDIKGKSQQVDLYGCERVIEAVQVQLPPHVCPTCSSVAHRHDQRTLKRIVDVPQGIYRTYINLAFARAKCSSPACGAVLKPPRPVSLHQKFRATLRLVDFVEMQCLTLERQFSTIADDVGISERTLRDMFDALFLRVAREVLPLVTPGTLRFTVHQLNGEFCYVIENLSVGTLVDIIKVADVRTLKKWGHEAARLRPPSRVLIPPDKELLKLLGSILPSNCRIALEPHAFGSELLGRCDRANSLVTGSAVLGILNRLQTLQVGRRGYLRKQLQAETVNLPELGVWLSEWEDLLLASLRTDEQPDLKLNRSVKILNLLGNGYSFDRLRGRLLISTEQVKLHVHDSISKRDDETFQGTPSTDFFQLATPFSSTDFRGEAIGRLGIPLGKLLTVLEMLAETHQNPLRPPVDDDDEDGFFLVWPGPGR